MGGPLWRARWPGREGGTSGGGDGSRKESKDWYNEVGIIQLLVSTYLEFSSGQ